MIIKRLYCHFQVLQLVYLDSSLSSSFIEHPKVYFSSIQEHIEHYFAFKYVMFIVLFGLIPVTCLATSNCTKSFFMVRIAINKNV
jgi:hypothetical protein